MPIYGMIYFAALAAGALCLFIGILVMARAAKDSSAKGFYLGAGLFLIIVAVGAFWMAHSISNVKIPPGG
jgi:dipeptide/tripeptide permease